MVGRVVVRLVAFWLGEALQGRQVPVGLARAWQGGVRFVPLWYGEAGMVWWCVFRCGDARSVGAWFGRRGEVR